MPDLAAPIATELARLDPKLLARLPWDSEGFWTGHAMLDALIQLQRPVDASALASIAEGFPTEATILMLQNPGANRALLAAIHAHRGGAEWVAASNALARMRAPGFAATLLAEIPLTHSVWVTDTGDMPGRGFAGSLASSSPEMRAPSGFPPIGFYRLTSQHVPGAELVSDGPTPIYSQRATIEPGVDRTLTWPPEGYCSQCLEVAYLVDLARVSKAEVERAVEPHTSVKWTNLLQLGAEISQAVAGQQSALNGLAKSLISAGVMDAPELGITRHIEVRIEDQRSDRSAALPKYPPVEFQLR